MRIEAREEKSRREIQESSDKHGFYKSEVVVINTQQWEHRGCTAGCSERCSPLSSLCSSSNSAVNQNFAWLTTSSGIQRKRKRTARSTVYPLKKDQGKDSNHQCASSNAF